ncbi:MAG: STAS domain-containing protein [Planctomycetia bacterium]|nr:STAS domain-containing protein [Planctomycetia bacterium]
MATNVMHGWALEVDRGPDWVFVRLNPPASSEAAPALADDLWSIVRQHMVDRIVLEMHDVDFLSSHLIGQLVLLHKRLSAGGGIMRLCGLSPSGCDVLRMAGLSPRFPNYANRDDAVRGEVAVKPR